MVDVAQPSLDALAEISRELVRLAIVDGDELVFVAKAQGATRGLRYDPDMGLSVRLSCSAAGHAWLATLSDEQALALVAKQGLGQPQDYGPRAPTTIAALLSQLRATRSRGYSMISDMFAPAMASMAAPVVLSRHDAGRGDDRRADGAHDRRAHGRPRWRAASHGGRGGRAQRVIDAVPQTRGLSQKRRLGRGIGWTVS